MLHAILTDDDNTTCYVGMTANEFKKRFHNHHKSFREQKYANKTELANYVWNLKKSKKSFTMKWSILKKTSSFQNGSKRCPLCLEEKLWIIKLNKESLLNKRSELISKCRHKRKFFVQNLPHKGLT